MIIADGENVGELDHIDMCGSYVLPVNLVKAFHHHSSVHSTDDCCGTDWWCGRLISFNQTNIPGLHPVPFVSGSMALYILYPTLCVITRPFVSYEVKSKLFVHIQLWDLMWMMIPYLGTIDYTLQWHTCLHNLMDARTRREIAGVVVGWWNDARYWEEWVVHGRCVVDCHVSIGLYPLGPPLLLCISLIFCCPRWLKVKSFATAAAAAKLRRKEE